MRRISSRMTFFYKRIFLVFWFGFLILFIAIPLFFGGARNGPPPFPFLIVPLIMFGFGYFVMKKLVFDLVDESLGRGRDPAHKKQRPGGARRASRDQECQLFDVCKS